MMKALLEREEAREKAKAEAQAAAAKAGRTAERKTAQSASPTTQGSEYKSKEEMEIAEAELFGKALAGHKNIILLLGSPYKEKSYSRAHLMGA